MFMLQYQSKMSYVLRSHSISQYLERLYFSEKLNLVFFFHLNPEILAKLFNLIYYLTLTLTPQLSPSPNRKPNIKYSRMNIAQCSFVSVK